MSPTRTRFRDPFATISGIFNSEIVMADETKGLVASMSSFLFCEHLYSLPFGTFDFFGQRGEKVIYINCIADKLLLCIRKKILCIVSLRLANFYNSVLFCLLMSRISSIKNWESSINYYTF